jgi:hypothetical protein
MFITNSRSKTGYMASGEQRAGGLYLLLACADERPDSSLGETCPVCNLLHPLHKELRGLVRSVQLRQFGHFMMGDMTINGVRIGVSGPLGSDGLPKNQDEVPWDQMVPVDIETAHAYWTDTTGHNDVGVSGKNLRQWAEENMDALIVAGRSKKERGGLLRKDASSNLKRGKQLP